MWASLSARLRLRYLAGEVISEGVLPSKWEMKTLNQNLVKIGQISTVSATVDRLTKIAEKVSFLKYAKMSPKPIAVNRLSRKRRLPYIVCELRVMGRVDDVISLI